MDVVSSGPAMFAGLFAMLPLEEVVYHGIVLGTSSARHTLRDTSIHMHITLELLVTATRTVPEKDCKRYSPELNMLKIYTETTVLIVLGVFLISYFMFYFAFLFLI